MSGEVISRELLEELEMAGQDLKRGAGRKQRNAVIDQVAYRMGRAATQVRASFLNAKLRQYDDQISSWIVTLNARKDELERQTKDVFAWSGHGLAMIIGFSILATALAVDYMIIHEFWSRVLSNEFGEVPKSLASSVMFKSAQVVFATLAFHFMLETVGNVGRRIFALFIFFLTFVMLLGIGLIIANSWLPPGSELFGIDLKGIADQGQNMLASLGLGSSPAPAGAAGPVNEQDVRTVQTLVWLGSLSAIFIIVTGVGAMCMRFGIHGFQGIFGEITFDTRNGGAARLGFRKDELVRVKTTLAHFKDAKSRWRILERHLSDFVTSYSEGIRRYESAFGDFGRHLMKRDVTAQRRLEELEQAVRQVEQHWTLEEVRRRHAVDEFDEPTTVDTENEDRKEPGFTSNVLDMFNHNNRRSGTDD